MKVFNKLWQSAVMASMIAAPLALAQVTIYMCGDSTMQDWAAGYYPKQGIGQNFQYFWDANNVSVYNYGKGGTYAMGYYNSFWPDIKSKLKSGDYVIIQFGINDRSYSNEEDFVTATTAMANEALAAGATPIIINPVRRSDYRCSVTTLKTALCDGSMVPDSVYESYHGYPIRAREIAASLNVPLIDMDTLSRNYLLSVGQYYALHYVNMVMDEGEYSTYANGNNDNLHLQENGAIAFGRITTEQMRVHSNAKVKALAKYLAPMYQLDVKVSPEGSDSASTISAYYPAGMPVTLKTTPKAGKTFLGWYNGKGEKCANTQSSVKSEYICTFNMGAASTQYTAVYSGGTALLYTGDGKALESFPEGTPRTLEEAKQADIVTVDTTVTYDKNIKKWFDAYMPDSGEGLSQYDHLDYTGEGFFNFDNSLGSSANYQMSFPAAGYVTMGIRYSFLGTSNRELNVYLDHDYYVSFKSTGSWDTWDTAWVNVDLAKGEETLKLISTSLDGGPNIDAFGFSLEGVCRVSEGCEESGSPNDPTAIASSAVIGSTIRLNGNSLELSNMGRAYVSVFDMQGQLKAKKIVETGSLDMSATVKNVGVYRVVVRQGSAKFSANWVKLK